MSVQDFAQDLPRLFQETQEISPTLASLALSPFLSQATHAIDNAHSSNLGLDIHHHRLLSTAAAAAAAAAATATLSQRVPFSWLHFPLFPFSSHSLAQHLPRPTMASLVSRAATALLVASSVANAAYFSIDSDGEWLLVVGSSASATQTLGMSPY